MAASDISSHSPAPFDTLKPFSFSGVPFPYKSYRVKGAYRKHIHEYPHAAAGAPEKLGRSLYEVTVTVDFNSGLDHPKYGQLLQDLNIQRGLWEQGQTAPLHVPHIGTFDAFADEWTEDVHNTNRSGVLTEIKFIEDLTNAFLVLNPAGVSKQSVQSASDDFKVAAQALPGTSIFDAVNDFALQIFSISDQNDLYGGLLAAKVEGFTQLMKHADATVKELGQPQYWQLRESLDRLRSAAYDLRDDLHARDALLKDWEVPLVMSVSQISAAIYGDFTRGGEIMQLNVLPDPLQVAPGTVIHYYKAA